MQIARLIEEELELFNFCRRTLDTSGYDGRTDGVSVTTHSGDPEAIYL